MIKKTIALSILMSATGMLQAGKNKIDCPPLTKENFAAFKEQETCTINGIEYQVNGACQKMLQDVNLVIEHEQEDYSKTFSGKISCWYKTNAGYFGIDQKR